MRDALFFPLAVAVAGAFIVTALQPFVDRPPRGPVSCGECTNKEDKTIAGAELHKFVPGNYDGIAIVKSSDGEASALRVTRLADQVYEDPRSGPHVVLAEDLEYAFESREIEIIFEARAVSDFGASQYQANYFARSEGESGWQTFNLTRDFQTQSFRFTTPPRGETEGYDYLGIRPVAPDKRRVMEVRSVRIHTVGAKTAPAATPG
jgi:hypothetical protein